MNDKKEDLKKDFKDCDYNSITILAQKYNIKAKDEIIKNLKDERQKDREMEYKRFIASCITIIILWAIFFFSPR